MPMEVFPQIFDCSSGPGQWTCISHSPIFWQLKIFSNRLSTSAPSAFRRLIEAKRIAVKTVAKLAKLLRQKWCAAVADFRLFKVAISLFFPFFFSLANYVFVRTTVDGSCVHKDCVLASSCSHLCGFTVVRWIIHSRVQIDRLRAIRCTRRTRNEKLFDSLLLFFR